VASRSGDRPAKFDSPFMPGLVPGMMFLATVIASEAKRDDAIQVK
jgi:hypothetical protein